MIGSVDAWVEEAHSETGGRCRRCHLHRSACLCKLTPVVETRTRVVIVLHRREARKTTNTGGLAHLCLANSLLLMRGNREDGAANAIPKWDELGVPVLLYPYPDAEPLEAIRDRVDRPLTLVVPDGTWRQAQRVRHRLAGLKDIPCAAIRPQAPSTYRLRFTPHPDRLATIEAIAEALGILEGPAPRTALLDIFHLMVERTLRASGRLGVPWAASGR